MDNNSMQIIQVKPVNEADSIDAFIQNELYQSLRHVYESTRISTEINNLNTKLDSLSSIRKAISVDSNNNQTAALANMNTTIANLENEINEKKKQMSTAESEVVKGFQTILQRVMERNKMEADSASAEINKALTNFSTLVSSTVHDKLAEVQKVVDKLQKEKMSVSEKETIEKTMELFKQNVIEAQKKALSVLKSTNMDEFKGLQNQINSILETHEPTAIITTVQQRVTESMNSRLREHLKDVERRNRELQANSEVSEKLAAFVKKEIAEQVDPSNLQKIITNLPEYQALQNLRESAAAAQENPQHATDISALKELTSKVASEVAELKNKSSTTRHLVNDIIEKGLPHQPSPYEGTEVTTSLDQSATVKHVEEMEKEIQLIYNNIKMMETVITTKAQMIASESSESDANDNNSLESRKRIRLDDSAELVTTEEDTSNRAILARLQEIETKHQKLVDFIYQGKDTVLELDFPDRLEAAMKKIEQVLLNHETFIAYLIDPFNTTKRLKQKASITTADPSSPLNPAMLTAISQLVKQTAEEISLPLQQRIKELEDKLEAKQQQ